MTDIKLLVFVCNWCSYQGADIAGGLKLEYPSGVRLVKVMCSGRVDAQMVVEGFRKGADGVMILGCHPGDCHYKTGNIEAQKRAMLLELMLKQFGIGKGRFKLDWVSAAEGERFCKVVTEMFDSITRMGKLKLHDKDLKEVSQ